jgi:hypothetical protein
MQAMDDSAVKDVEIPEGEEQELVPSERADKEFTRAEIKEMKAIATSLINPQDGKSDQFVLGACITMLCARQIYMASLVDLDKRLGELQVKHQDGVRQTLVEAMQNQAQRPFGRMDLVEKLQKHALPWLVATAQSEDAKAAKEVEIQEKQLDEARRERAVPIGFPLVQDLPDDPKDMGRERTILLAGHAGAVKYLIRLAGATALKQPESQDVAKLRVIHLSSYDPPFRNKSKRVNKDKLHLVLSLNQWQHHCKSEKKFAELMLPRCATMRRQGLDLLLVDDITQLMEMSLSTSTPIRTAQSAHRYLRKWADRAGCAVICGLPLNANKSCPEIDDTWGDIEVFTTLRRVMVEDGGYDEDYEHDTYKIFFNNKALAAQLVDQKIIDNYGVPNVAT